MTYGQLSPKQLDAINVQDAEIRQLQKLGHLVMLETRHRYGLDERVPSDFKVWSGCTCMRWLSSTTFTSIEAAVAAHAKHAEGKK